MIPKLILTLTLMLALAACKKSETKNEIAPVTHQAATTQPITTCYRYATARDTVSMTMVRSGDSVRGQLLYRWFEKDGNTGDFTGSFKGDTLFIEYTFQSEGMMSVREEQFLVNGPEVIKGIGNIVEKDGEQVFENARKVTFDRTLVLNKTDCQSN